MPELLLAAHCTFCYGLVEFSREALLELANLAPNGLSGSFVDLVQATGQRLHPYKYRHLPEAVRLTFNKQCEERRD